MTGDFGLECFNSSAAQCPPEEEYHEELDLTKITVLSLMTVLTVLGNCLVILAILARNVKVTRMYYFIIHLSVADLLTALLTLLPEIVWTATSPYFYGGNLTCKSVKFVQMLGPYLSSYVLIMTAIDRYFQHYEKNSFSFIYTYFGFKATRGHLWL